MNQVDIHTILAIETSCDDTSAAVIRDGQVLSVVVASQEEHDDWGGVVPEIASRAHLTVIHAVLKQTLDRASVTYSDLDAVAVTTQPGLIGSLLVGTNTAKGIAVARNIPLIAINHIEAHLLSVLIENEIEFPYLAMVVSGGHTLIYDVTAAGSYELLGATRDDAAGEAFDKGAKLLGLGYPGGPMVDKLAKDGDPKSHHFPRGLIDHPSFDFSFSGLKTALRYYVRDTYGENGVPESDLSDLCASYQEAIIEPLVRKLFRAAEESGRERVAIVGGVSANSRLRAVAEEQASKLELKLYLTSPLYSTDNAAMIGLAAYFRARDYSFDPLTVTAKASLSDAHAIKSRREKKSSATS